MTVGSIAFGSVSGEENVDVARALRVVLAAVDDDVKGAAVIAEEAARDPRGFELATWELVVSLGVTIARTWVVQTSVEDVRTAVRGMLLEYEQSK